MWTHDPTISLPDFAATVMREEGGMPILSVFGEIDLNTVHELDILMMKAVAEAGEGGSVVVDLSGVEFLDLSGLGVLIKGRSILKNSPGGSLNVVCESRVARLFEVTDGLIESFDLYPDVGSAVAGYPVSA